MPNLLSPGTAWPGLFWDAVLSSTGAPVVNTPVTVYQSDGSTVATIYSTRAQASLSNPISTDAYGNLQFYAFPGIYQLAYTVGGVPGTRFVQVNPDFSDSAWNVTTDSGGAPPTPVSGDCRLANAAGNTVAYALPPPMQGARFKFIKTDSADAFEVTITASGASIVGGFGTVTVVRLYTQGQTLTVMCDGTNYYADDVGPHVPAGNMYCGTAPSVGSNSIVVLDGMVSTYAINGMVFNSSGNVMVVPVAGYYRVDVSVGWNTGGSSVYGAFIMVGGTPTGRPVYVQGDATTGTPVVPLNTDTVYIPAGAGVGLGAQQQSGTPQSPINDSRTSLTIKLDSY